MLVVRTRKARTTSISLFENTLSHANAMHSNTPDAIITLRDLIDAFVKQQQYHGKDRNEFNEYYDLKLELLVELFGCDLDARQKDLTRESRKQLHSSGPERYDLQPSAVGFFRDCITVLNQNDTPFHYGVVMEGLPSKIERDIWDRFGRQMIDERGRFNDTVVDAAVATLTLLFPEIEAQDHTWSELFARGLPLEEPDPSDWF